MFNRGNSAVSITEKLKKEQEKETQPWIQIEELQKQSALLVDSKLISKENAELMRLLLEQSRQNAECTRQILECTRQNQISSNRQFKASFSVSVIAMIIALISLFVK